MSYVEYKVVVHDNGGTFWYDSDNKLHREGDQPAIALRCGYKAYYTHGKLNRLTGPAIIHADGGGEYWLDGFWMTMEQHEALTNPAKEMTVAELEAALGYKIKVVK